MAKHWETAVIISDVHCPWIDIKLHKAFINFLTDTKPDRFIINGDFLDLETFAQYSEGSVWKLRNLTLDKEYDSGNEILDDYDRVLSNRCNKEFLVGNHEKRYYDHKKRYDHAKYGESLLSPVVGLDLINRGYTVYDDYMTDYTTIGEYKVMHGFSTSINTANTMATKAMCSTIVGHTHRPQMITRGEVTSIVTGCMCDISSQGFSYMNIVNRSSWRNGFLVTHRNLKTGEVIPQQINATADGVFYYGNTRY